MIDIRTMIEPKSGAVFASLLDLKKAIDANRDLVARTVDASDDFSELEREIFKDTYGEACMQIVGMLSRAEDVTLAERGR